LLCSSAGEAGVKALHIGAGDLCFSSAGDRCDAAECPLNADRVEMLGASQRFARRPTVRVGKMAYVTRAADHMRRLTVRAGTSSIRCILEIVCTRSIADPIVSLSSLHVKNAEHCFLSESI
jgi:hypothetical protein